MESTGAGNWSVGYQGRVYDQGGSHASDEEWLDHSLLFMWSQQNFIWIDIECERIDE